VRNMPGRLHAGSMVILRTRRTGVLSLDGKSIPFDSPSLTVDELLDTYSVALLGDDRVLPGRDTVLTNGMAVTVVRVGGDVEQQTEPIPFVEERQPDPTIAVGTTRVVREGVPGVMTLSYRSITENGAVTGRTLLSKVPAIAATSRIVAYGTQADWHWDALARCEANGRGSTVVATPEGSETHGPE